MPADKGAARRFLTAGLDPYPEHVRELYASVTAKADADGLTLDDGRHVTAATVKLEHAPQSCSVGQDVALLKGYAPLPEVLLGSRTIGAALLGV
jgi:hypothetical protein